MELRARTTPDNAFDGLLALAGAAFVAHAFALHGFGAAGAWMEGLRLAGLSLLPLFALRFFAGLGGAGGRRWAYIGGRRFEAVVSILALAVIAGVVFVPGDHIVVQAARGFRGPLETMVIFLQIFTAAGFVADWGRTHERLSAKRVEPAQLLGISYVMLVILGTFLLLAPNATSPEVALHPVDALFTAASATSVTGLVVIETGTGFTAFGQAVILGLIQIGGLGLMTFTAFLVYLSGGAVGIQERFIMGELLAERTLGRVGRAVAAIVAVTVALEVVGGILLTAPFESHGSERPFFDGMFHSVSAFCNAGFSTRPAAVADTMGIAAVLLALFVFGGLGFGVIVELFGRARKFRGNRPLTLHTRLALGSTAVLLVGGAVGILAVEWNAGLSELGWGERAWAAFFHSATARTAGFSLIDVGGLRDASLVLLCVLMFIGASPGGTGGGVKTTTMAVQVASLGSILARRPRLEVFQRTIPADVVSRAVAVVLSAFLLVVVSVFALTILEDRPFMDLLFEVVSAVSTTGLSTGITAELTLLSKLILVVDMILGRIGPLSLFLLLGRPRRAPLRRYADESVLIG